MNKVCIFVGIKEKTMSKETLTLSQEIDIAMIKLNLVQAEVVDALVKEGVPMNTSKFSILKNSGGFTGAEIKGLNKVLKTNLC